MYFIILCPHIPASIRVAWDFRVGRLKVHLQFAWPLTVPGLMSFFSAVVTYDVHSCPGPFIVHLYVRRHFSHRFGSVTHGVILLHEHAVGSFSHGGLPWSRLGFVVWMVG
jgi:hypothetical protein